MRGMAAVAASIEEAIRPGFFGRARSRTTPPPVAKTPVAKVATTEVDDLEPTIFRFILKHSLRQQILLLLLTLASFPFLYYSLSLPKTIINEAIREKAQFPHEFLGIEFERVPFLMMLCAGFLILVLFNGAFKYCINTFKGQLGERMLRRLRYQLYQRLLRFPLTHFQKTSSAQIIPMITAECESIGGFIGDAFAAPAFQGGTLLTLILFMLIQDPVLGTAAI